MGYVIQKNGEQEAQVTDRAKRAMAVMGQVWRIGKRRFRRNWARRLWICDRLVWTVLKYSVEVWGWRKRDRIEGVEERYLRWLLGGERSDI